jgi:hypothetical protein
MKTLLFAALLLITPSLFAATVNTKNSAGNDVTIDTSATGITVHDRYYQDEEAQTVPGSYTIDGKKGSVPYVNIHYGFRIDDPALAKAIDGHTSKVVLTFESEPLGARAPYLVTVTLP